MFTAALLAFLLPSFALAQYGGPPAPQPGTTSSAPASAPSAPANTPGNINIDVAFNGNFVFNPANISAPIGTLVTFWFPNTGIPHSVTQSSFANPCTFLNITSNNTFGFDSGLTQDVQFTINVTSTDPIWFHCKQVLHCGMGMVGSINAPSSGNNTFDAFMQAAMAIGSNEQTEQDNGPVTGGVGAIATATPAATGTGAAGSTSNSGANQVRASIGLMAQ
ncbi:Cupredoxin [Cyathus striatus]|nr:Cupredoxin [Cyathus striatus]